MIQAKTTKKQYSVQIGTIHCFEISKSQHKITRALHNNKVKLIVVVNLQTMYDHVRSENDLVLT